MRTFYRKFILPYLGFIPFLVNWPILLLIGLFRNAFVKKDPVKDSLLCIEAGIKGWESIEFKELYLSACEFLDEKRVARIEINREEDYLAQVKKAITKNRPTHYFYDPRTGSQDWMAGLWQSVRISWLLYSRGIIPVVLLTDFSIRTWRAQSAVMTARSGVVIIFMSPRIVCHDFPHRRLTGPSLVPLSVATLEKISAESAVKSLPLSQQASFIGSLYEPRTSTLKKIEAGLAERGLILEIKGRTLGSVRKPDSEYWSVMIHAEIVITTADQNRSNSRDWTWRSHMVYRYLEAMACGTLLVAPEVPGIRRFFIPGEHYACFNTEEEAIDIIAYYLTHETERSALAQKGKKRADDLIYARAFWTGIDTVLGRHSLS